MKPEIVPAIVTFVQSNSMLSSHFRVIHHHAIEGLKSKNTINKMLQQRTKGAMVRYETVFGIKIQSGCAVREAAKALAKAFNIPTIDP
ncbi:hypothetical protein R6242_21160 [Iodobacter sp. CM08]|uniref:hypothetical protein n=1 Tax=Iodobacter sp. CM08 TaxID=3085902 RepID=UPI0029825744|nr:hypothetical protein [Iodobacter sp. CM08]MDW5419085.1 hypothetical protein [Iodobacter sp. CM08]